jgi:hypothetical protein
MAKDATDLHYAIRNMLYIIRDVLHYLTGAISRMTASTHIYTNDMIIGWTQSHLGSSPWNFPQVGVPHNANNIFDACPAFSFADSDAH